jgi:hypothetical protein
MPKNCFENPAFECLEPGRPSAWVTAPGRLGREAVSIVAWANGGRKRWFTLLSGTACSFSREGFLRRAERQLRPNDSLVDDPV